MQIYIINPKSDFTEEQISKLEECGNVFFIEGEKIDIQNQPYLYDPEEKIIAISPELVDWEFENQTIEKISNLRAICLSTTSFDWVDGKICREKNIALTNVPHYSTNAVAEYAAFLMLSLARKLPLQIKSGFQCTYSEDMIAAEIKGKTIGVIGLGHIGQRIAELGSGLGMNVIYWSKNKKEVPFRYVELEKLLEEADFVFVSLALNEETKNLLPKELLSHLKKSANFITVVSEGIEDREYLIKQVEAGNLAGLAFESEKDKLMNYSGNIMITSPYAWYTNEALKNNIEIWTDTMISVCKRTPINVVN